METKIKANRLPNCKAGMVIYTIVTAFFLSSNFVFAQWQQGGGWSDRWGETRDLGGTWNDVRRIGIGNFTNNTNFGQPGPPRAALNIDANLLTDIKQYKPNFFLPGVLFRTDGPANRINTWTMWTGAGNQASEKGGFFVNANSNDFNIQSSEGFLLLNPNSNFVGVGFTNPNYQLDVDGDIAVDPLANGYRIGNDYVLWHRGITSSINVGVGAGVNNTGTRNVFIGFEAGNTNTTSGANVFIGFKAGFSNTTGRWNTFTGLLAGEDNTSGRGNSFYGKHAGSGNTTGHWNAFFGAHSGEKNSAGSDGNTFMGINSGLNNNGDDNISIGIWAGEKNNGDNNIFIGRFAGQNSQGNDNTMTGREAGIDNQGNNNAFYGRMAGNSNTTGSNNTYIGANAEGNAAINNASAIGANAEVMENDHMILGNNDVNVGIGLSGITPGPQTRLEINAIADANPADDVIPGESGLRFRDLTTASTLQTNLFFPDPAVLSVDADGNVILVLDEGGTGAADADWYDVSNPGNPPTNINNSIYTRGDAGIGINNPQHRLHLNKVIPFIKSNTVYVQFTNRFTDSSATDGFLVGIDVYGNSELRNQELTRHMMFFTEDNERVRITNAGDVGINTVFPGNKMEINSNATTPFPGSSGLRFTDLNSNSTPQATNPFTPPAVLSVDANGDVILVLDEIGGGLSCWDLDGNGVCDLATEDIDGDGDCDAVDCQGTGGADNDWEITSSGNDVFTGTSGVNPNLPEGNVGIGISAPAAKLDVLQDDKTSGVIGINVLNTDANAVGIRSVVTDSSSLNTAGFFQSHTESNAIIVPFQGGRVGFGTINPLPAYQLHVVGDVNINGDAYSNQGLLTSDSVFKTNIDTLKNALAKINQLQGIYYEWDTLAYPDKNFTAGRKIGFIAQQVQPILPEVVVIDDSGFYHLNYDRIIPVLVEAMKEQQLIIDSLSTMIISNPNLSSIISRLDSIENCLANLPPGLGCGSGSRMKTGDNGYDNGKYCITSVINIIPDNSVVSKETKLEQNKPNPFRYSTQFDYYIGAAGYVELIIHSYDGKHIATLLSGQKDEGSYSVNWNTTDIAPGVYFYSLKVDGVEWVKKAIKIK